MGPERSGPPFLVPPPAGPLEPASRPPTFSVAIASYQAEATVPAAVESALGQTVPPLEVIVCDDCSTDDTERALAPYRDRITYIRLEQNGGEGAAKRAATEAATGDFVSMLDADDTYEPERLELFGKLAMGRPDLDVLAADAYIDVRGKTVRYAYSDDWTFPVDDQRTEILRRCFVVSHVAIRRARLVAVGGFNPRMRSVADWDLTARLVLSGSHIGLVDEPLSRYSMNEGSLASSGASFHGWELEALRGIARDSTLSADERTVLEATIGRHEAILAIAEAKAALVARRPDRRSRSVAVARDARNSWPVRLKSALCAVAPNVGLMLLRRRDRRYWTGPGGMYIKRPRDERGS